MIGLTSPNSEASATLAAQVITSIGALVLLVTLVAFVIALFEEWKVVRDYNEKKRNCKFFESMSRVKPKFR
ncbi:hypothetical protein FLM48_18955 [Shewanella sp. Scap07]|uniref:hypothetical protein n=1 Tax=Shewanella sp. Scap07 TaxID=2589987 RepID=UPI0015B902CA|nr:hypothetical protein [Shewanella sp. Scap07]QLE86966.1 hypothetical protein FLM48_18955 [Shewanella sp. Scap07]